MAVTRVPLRERLRRSRVANGAGALLPGSGRGRRRISIVESFNYAVEGIIHVLRTHRNMRIHLAAAVLVLLLALWIGVNRIELVMLLLAIAFVLIAEMMNSAIEAAIDVATSSFDPLAKLAKDIAAGAVLIASINAVAVGYLVFSGHVSESTTNFFDRLRDAPIKLTLIALILVVIIVIATKAISGRGTPLRGGLPSGHAAIAFAAWMAVTLTLGPSEHRFFVSTMPWRCSSPTPVSSRECIRRSRSSTAARSAPASHS
jgi:diacylglycerol kinase (ATP)